jgi:membrane protein implicated in regulation of membrane protease activity
MPEIGMDNTNASNPSPEESRDQGTNHPAPYEDLLSEVVAKIKDQPFLFVIAIVALIIGVVVLGARLGSADLQFVITIIALLAVVVIAGYYVREGMKMAARKRKAEEPQGQRTTPVRQQKIEATDGAKIDGALLEGSGVESQVIVARGKGTSVKDVVQTSTGDPSDKERQT